jgi:hypothetical protein
MPEPGIKASTKYSPMLHALGVLPLPFPGLRRQTRRLRSGKAMNDRLTLKELEKRWENVLSLTRRAVLKHPAVYRQLKSLAGDIVGKPLDIKEYLPTAERLACLLETMDPENGGTIFHFFRSRISPSSIWQVPLLRVECRDLLAHLEAFDQWRLKTCNLKLVK